MIRPTISELYQKLNGSCEADFYWDEETSFIDVYCFNTKNGAQTPLTLRVSTKAATFRGKLLTSFEKTPFYFCNYSSVDKLVRDLVNLIKDFSKTLVVTRKRKSTSNLIGIY